MQDEPLEPSEEEVTSWIGSMLAPEEENEGDIYEPDDDLPKLKVNEIFFSIQGESTTAGLPTVFIRLTGCPLRCSYCDTAYAFKVGEWMTLDEILAKVREYTPVYICLTGGEPLAHKFSLPLLKLLCDEDYEVSVETSGAIDVSKVDARVVKVMDLKTPSSGEQERNLFSNIKHLDPQDQIKFVIGNREDYEWSKQVVLEHDLRAQGEVLFSPQYGILDARQLAEWILEDNLNVRLQIQLHKVLWGEEQGR